MAVAAVVGATGAIGKEVVKQLLADSQWSKVVTVGRREVAIDGSDATAATKLVQKVVDMEQLQGNVAAFEGASAVFCALGTTRKDAGTAEAFKKVDLQYVEAAAVASKAAGVKHFSLVTAQGANAKVWASDWAIVHPLLYTRTKGLAEEAAKKQGFATLSIFRPGLLDRGDKARGIEKMISAVASGVKVSDVAKVMILDAKRALGLRGDSGSCSAEPVAVYEDKAIRKSAAAGTPSVS